MGLRRLRGHDHPADQGAVARGGPVAGPRPPPRRPARLTGASGQPQLYVHNTDWFGVINGRRGQPKKVSFSRYTFMKMISAAMTPVVMVVRRRFTSAPMMSRRRVSSSSGTSANGMPKDS